MTRPDHLKRCERCGLIRATRTAPLCISCKPIPGRDYGNPDAPDIPLPAGEWRPVGPWRTLRFFPDARTA